MPVIKMSEEEIKGKLLKGNIKKRMEAKQLTDKQMAKCLGGIHPETFRQKVRHPERFTYPQLITVFRILEFSEAEKLEVI